jgi:hypothetical protein
MPQKLISIFIKSAGVLLILTASAKLISSFGTANILLTPDPIFLISFRHVFRLVAVAEFGVAAVCFLNKNRRFQNGLIALLASNFALYRFGFYLLGFRRACPCWGNLTDAMHVPPQTADTIAKVILVYLIVGSYSILFRLWHQKRNIQLAAPLVK